MRDTCGVYLMRTINEHISYRKVVLEEVAALHDDWTECQLHSRANQTATKHLDTLVANGGVKLVNGGTRVFQHVQNEESVRTYLREILPKENFNDKRRNKRNSASFVARALPTPKLTLSSQTSTSCKRRIPARGQLVPDALERLLLAQKPRQITESKLRFIEEDTTSVLQKGMIRSRRTAISMYIDSIQGFGKLPPATAQHLGRVMIENRDAFFYALIQEKSTERKVASYLEMAYKENRWLFRRKNVAIGRSFRDFLEETTLSSHQESASEREELYRTQRIHPVIISRIGKEFFERQKISSLPKFAIAQKAYETYISAREALVNSVLFLSLSIANNIAARGEWSEEKVLELTQAGNAGAIRGVEMWNPELGFALSTYVTWWIIQHIYKNNLFQQGIKDGNHWSIRLRCNAANQILSQEYNRKATTTEIATYLDLPESIIDAAYKQTKARLSLDREIGPDQETTFGDGLASKIDTAQHSILSIDQRDFWRTLESLMLRNSRYPTKKKRAYDMIHAKFTGETFREIAATYSVSPECVRQTIQNELKILYLSPRARRKLEQFYTAITEGIEEIE